MGLSTRIVATYTSQMYAVILGLVMAPVYLRLLGSEAYGLIGFFVMLQSWFQLFDFGLTSAMAREVARQRNTETDLQGLRKLLRAIEGLFLMLGVVAIAAMVTSSDWAAVSWLQPGLLPHHKVVASLQLIAFIVVMRWVAELYRGLITGFEQLTWLSGFNASIASARFLLVLPLMLLVNPDVVFFFALQLLVAIVETTWLAHKAYRMLPRQAGHAPWSLEPLRPIFRLSLTLFMLSIVWVATSHTDKLLLSGALSLAEYATFMLAVSVTGGVLLLCAPISTVLMPRLAALEARGDELAVIALYRNATQWVGILAWPSAALMSLHAERIMWIWTGDPVLSRNAATTVALYAWGNAFMAVGALPFYLQHAKGRLNLHLLGTVLFLLPLIGILLWSVPRYGALGAAWSWLIVNALYFVAWVPVAHRYFAPRAMHWRWMIEDVLPIALLTSIGAALSLWLPWSTTRIEAGAQLMAVALFVVMFGALGSSWAISTAWPRRWQPGRANRTRAVEPPP